MALGQTQTGTHRKQTLSFEFFPPRDNAGIEKLVTGTASKLSAFRPDFCSVTYGAGGTTKDGTQALVSRLLQEGLDTVPHLSFGGSSEDELNTLVDQYRAMGVKKILCLRGDSPSGDASRPIYAKHLVTHLQARYGSELGLGVAAYPEVHPDAKNAEEDMGYFADKVQAGAQWAITQYFYNTEAYGYFLQGCERAGLAIPVHVGVMPITNIEALQRFSAKAGADIPRWLAKSMTIYADREKDLIAYGVEVVTNLCEKLLQMGAPGLHFYTLNRWGASSQIARNLGFLDQ